MSNTIVGTRLCMSLLCLKLRLGHYDKLLLNQMNLLFHTHFTCETILVVPIAVWLEHQTCQMMIICWTWFESFYITHALLGQYAWGKVLTLKYSYWNALFQYHVAWLSRTQDSGSKGAPRIRLSSQILCYENQ